MEKGQSKFVEKAIKIESRVKSQKAVVKSQESRVKSPDLRNRVKSQESKSLIKRS